MTEEENMSHPKLLRLVTKEILICNVRTPENPEENFWWLEDPFEIRSFMNGQSGDFNSTLVDWLQFSSNNETKICVSDVLTCNDPDPEVMNHYMNIVARKKNETSRVDMNIDKEEIVDDVNEPEITFEDYIDILNSNKVFH
tara:strand:+ start:187 stop:609 length:423 start_codon:yes stop_codon:yes gene_type:complete